MPTFWSHVLSTWGGAALGIILQMALWPFRPQHPLRRVTAECWQETANLVELLNERATTSPNEAVVKQQALLRTTLDRTLVTLKAASSSRMRPLVARLEETPSACQDDFQRRSWHWIPHWRHVGSTGDWRRRLARFSPFSSRSRIVARSVALTIVSRQPSHLTSLDVRLRRLTNLLKAARARVQARGSSLPLRMNLADILEQIEDIVPEIQAAVRETIDRASERGAFSLELLDLHTWRLGTLRAALNLSSQVDRSLTRFILRLGTLLVPSVLVQAWLRIPHGYWLGLTLVVVDAA